MVRDINGLWRGQSEWWLASLVLVWQDDSLGARVRSGSDLLVRAAASVDEKNPASDRWQRCNYGGV